jgi:hypothetical protein
MPASTGPHACRRNLPWLGAVRLPRRITEHPALARRPDQALTYPSDTYVSGHLTRLGPATTSSSSSRCRARKHRPPTRSPPSTPPQSTRPSTGPVPAGRLQRLPRRRRIPGHRRRSPQLDRPARRSRRLHPHQRPGPIASRRLRPARPIRNPPVTGPRRSRPGHARTGPGQPAACPWTRTGADDECTSKPRPTVQWPRLRDNSELIARDRRDYAYSRSCSSSGRSSYLRTCAVEIAMLLFAKGLQDTPVKAPSGSIKDDIPQLNQSFYSIASLRKVMCFCEVVIDNDTVNTGRHG